MPMHQFGSGSMYGSTLIGGVLVPRKFGALQDISIDISYSKKKLFGQQQFPIAIVRGQGAITGKAKFANINAAMFNELFFGQTTAAGQQVPIFSEVGTIPTTPFQVTTANSATWLSDGGVVDTTSGLSMTRVASAPTTGQYSVAAGVYTFAAADAAHGVAIDYVYTLAGSGVTTTLINQQAGTTPTFRGVFVMKSAASPGNAVKQLVLTLNLCVSEKLGFSSKVEDFMIPELDFEAGADIAGNIGTLAGSE
jgi:hypothetical protein